ncbi:hypothetical protein LG202_06150 [Methylobacillus methanolivorans]
MYISKLLVTTATGVLLTASASAFAADTVYGKDFGNGPSHTTTINGTSVTFSAKTGNNKNKLIDGVFSYKPAQDGFQGVGVSPLKGGDVTVGEIDKNEWIFAEFTDSRVISNLTLGLLFDGPEYGDSKEKAFFTVTYFDNSTKEFKLQAQGETLALWTGGFGVVTNLSPASDGMGGVWSVDNPFGNTAVKSFTLTSHADKSDFTLYSVTAVPEPESYAMLALGLGLVGFMARRRDRSNLYV